MSIEPDFAGDLRRNTLELKYSKTCRGFDLIEFQDRYDLPCRLQKSSLGTEDAIWFGVTDVQPKVMAINAASVGVKTQETTGWVPYPVPDEVLLSSSMHLTRDQIAELLPVLEQFVKTGEIT